MLALFQPVILRVIAYALSSLIAMIPVAYAGAIHFDPATNTLTIGFSGLVAAAVSGIALSGGIFAKWGIKK
jgi:ABC-type nitrate/sulfonate/bicarbonate transport system substrate-binding protein